MDDTTHGPARQLAERAYDAADGDPYNNRLRHRVLADADALDARHAALVQAAERYVHTRDIHALDGYSAAQVAAAQVEAFEQLRAALEAVKGGEDE